MESTIKFDYFRGMEAEQYTFYKGNIAGVKFMLIQI